jgi:hypothetical protein
MPGEGRPLAAAHQDLVVDKPFELANRLFEVLLLSSAAKDANACSARPFRLTYFTPASVFPFVRARYGAHARGWTSQSRQNAR